MKGKSTLVTINENVKHESSTLDSEWYVKYSSRTNFLLRILYWTGLLENSGRRYMNAYFFFILYSLISVSISNDFFNLKGNFISKIALLYLSCCVISVFVWYSIRSKIKLLLDLFGKIYPFYLTKSQKLSLFCVFASFFALVITEAIKLKALNLPESLELAYGFKVNHDLKFFICIIQTSMGYILCPLWTNIVAILYCLVCQRISEELRHLSNQIRNYSPQEFTQTQQIYVLKHQSKLVETVQLLQNIFSLPSFMISIVNFTNCIILIAVLLNDFFEGLHCSFVIEWNIMITNCFGGLLACLWIAGSLPEEADVLLEEFRKKIRGRLFYFGKNDDISFEKELVGTSNFALSGYGIVHFQKSSIAALIGTILTYAVLLISKV